MQLLREEAVENCTHLQVSEAGGVAALCYTVSTVRSTVKHIKKLLTGAEMPLNGLAGAWTRRGSKRPLPSQEVHKHPPRPPSAQ